MDVQRSQVNRPLCNATRCLPRRRCPPPPELSYIMFQRPYHTNLAFKNILTKFRVYGSVFEDNAQFIKF